MITTMHSDQNASPPRVEVITLIAAASPLADRREDPGGRGDDAARDVGFRTRPGEQASLPACCSTGVDECWKAACKRSRLTKMSSARAGSVSWNDGRVRELERLLGRKTMEAEISPRKRSTSRG